MIINDLLIYGVALGAGALGALVVASYGREWSLLDRPNERSSHERETPKGGGVGILVAFVLCSLLSGVPVYFWATAFLISMLSFLGDRFEISVSVRLSAQFFMAFSLLFFLAIYHSYYSGYFLGLLISLFYLIFIVGTANYYNFMDGINGIAAIAGIVAFGLLGCYGSYSGKDPVLVKISFAVMAACAGFLPLNAPRARVFMGDVGSVLLGFVFAALVVMLAGSVTELIALAGFLFPFYADELVTLFERIRDGEKLTRAHRRHLYQVLANEGGVAHWRVAVVYGLMQLLVGLAAWKAAGGGLFTLLGTLSFFFVVFIMVNNKVKSRYLVSLHVKVRHK